MFWSLVQVLAGSPIMTIPILGLVFSWFQANQDIVYLITLRAAWVSYQAYRPRFWARFNLGGVMASHCFRSSQLSFVICITTASLLLACCGDGTSSSSSGTYLTVDYFTNGLTYPPSGISYPSGYWTPLSEAYEIVDQGAILPPNQASTTATLITYKDGGSNPISSSEWNSGYIPPSPYSINTPRYLQFNATYFIGSPGQPAGTTTYITTSDSYTWMTLSTVHNAMTTWSASSYPGTVNAFQAGN